MQYRSPSGASLAAGSLAFSLARDSPVSAASSIFRLRVSSRRRSAGTLSPEASRTMSPGISPDASISLRWPSRSTVALLESMRLMLSSAASARPSWMKPMIALTSTAAAMTPVSTQCPSSAVISDAPSIRYSRTLWNCSRKRSSGPRLRACGRRLAPWRCRRSSAWLAVSPSLLACRLVRQPSAGRLCQGLSGFCMSSSLEKVQPY